MKATIRTRTRKDGTATWQIMWREGGKQNGHTVYTEGDAELWKRAIELSDSYDAAAKVIRGAATGAVTVAQAVADHIELLIKPTSQTIATYRAMLENHIKPTIGAVPIVELEPKNVVAWVKTLRKNGLQPKTVRNVHALLSAALQRCVPKFIPVNPCDGIELPGTEKAEDHISFLTYEDFMKIHRALPEQYKTFALFLVVIGARFGEATAVTVGDLALTATPATVRINKSWKRTGTSGWVVGPPKTVTSKRTVALGDALTAELKTLTKGRGSEQLVFVNARGERINQAVFYRVWHATLKKIKSIDETFTVTPRVHDLRHTSASWLIQSGYDLFKVARRLGHANTSMVDKVYGHLMPEGLAEGARHMDAAMRPRELEQTDEDEK